jgi:CheY-like chemotaxis protein
MKLNTQAYNIEFDAERLETLRDMFIQNVSHELRTPLAIVQGYAELLKDGELGNLEPEQLKAMLVITNQAQALSTIVERIGILLSIQTHNELRVPVSMKSLVADVVDDQRAAAEEMGLTLNFEAAPDLPNVVGDNYHMTHALAGLVENAIKFTPSGGDIDVRLYAHDGMVCFEVADNGIGITEDKLGEIFNGFYQVDGSSTRRYGGLGLGLTLAKSIAELHDGYLEVESEADLGSRFRVCFPAMDEAVTLDGIPENSQRSRRILVVDDEESVALTLQVGLQKLQGFDVTVATNGKQALQLLEERHFDLLITDYRMPGMDGMSLAEQVRKRYPWTAIIMVTAYSSDDLRNQASRIAIQQILSKPIKLSEIRKIASDALALSQ